MATKIRQRTAWAIARRQHGVITRAQLLDLGFTDEAIRHRLARGRLRRLHAGVYAVGQLGLTQDGKWMAAVLACGEPAALSHVSAAALWQLTRAPAEPIHVSVLTGSRSRDGIAVHRPQALEVVRHNRIPTTTVPQTLIDLGRHPQLEQAVSEAILRRLVSAKAMRRQQRRRAGRRHRSGRSSSARPSA